MDKLIGKAVKKVMGAGEKIAPVKSIKLKVKFQKANKKMAEKKENKRRDKIRKAASKIFK